MKILLILPAAAHLRITTENPEVPNRAMKRFSVLPLTMVAAHTPEGHEVTICDENVQAIDLGFKADLVGISFMTATANRAYEIARSFRARGIPVVAGGYHATLFPADALSHFSAVVIGDADDTWPRVVADAEAGCLGAIYRHERSAEITGAVEPRRDLTRDTARHYATTNAVQAGRGCRHACTYCSVTAFHGQTYRVRPVADVVREIKRLPRDFIFVDDNIIADTAYARDLFNALVPLKKRWVSQCSLEIADDPALLRLAQQAGCRGLFIGIETVDSSNLRAVGKGFNQQSTYLTRLRAIHKAGIGVIAGMIVGMDSDRATVFESTLEFLQQARIECLQLNIMTPLPGTPLYRDLERRGRITDRNWDHYDFRHCVIQPAAMSAADLQDGADWLYRQFYRLDRVLVRTIRTAFTVGVVPAVLAWRINRTYRFDNAAQAIVGRNPAARSRRRPITARHVLVALRRRLRSLRTAAVRA